ncbi:MAG: hypothetical protein M3Z70_08605 [Bartonella sp.]|nr:hypothetical protein [Bartonella sp.]
MRQTPNSEARFGPRSTVLPRLPSFQTEGHPSATALFKRNDCIVHQLLSDVTFVTGWET